MAKRKTTKKRSKRAKRKAPSKTSLKTDKGNLVGFTKDGGDYRLVFRRNRQNVVGTTKFPTLTKLKAKVKRMLTAKGSSFAKKVKKRAKRRGSI